MPARGRGKDVMAESNDATRISGEKGKFKYSAPLGRRALLIIVSRKDFGRTHVIDEPGVVLGRQSDCELVIADPLLSRRHCMVTADEAGEYFIEDLNSTNSTTLNSRKLKGKTKLQFGDRIVIGNTILRFYHEEELDRK